MSTDSDLSVISDSLLEVIVQFLHKKLDSRKIRAVAMPEIYKAHETLIKDNQVKWLRALSTAIHQGRLKGFEVKRGKGGGVGFLDPRTKVVIPATSKEVSPPDEIEETETSVPVTIIASPVKEIDRHLMVAPKPIIKEIPVLKEESIILIGDKTFKVPCSLGRLRDILVLVFESKEDPEGNILFDGMKYTCSAWHYLDNFIFYTMGGAESSFCPEKPRN